MAKIKRGCMVLMHCMASACVLSKKGMLTYAKYEMTPVNIEIGSVQFFKKDTKVFILLDFFSTKLLNFVVMYAFEIDLFPYIQPFF